MGVCRSVIRVTAPASRADTLLPQSDPATILALYSALVPTIKKYLIVEDYAYSESYNMDEE